jgi:hypothetical protein
VRCGAFGARERFFHQRARLVQVPLLDRYVSEVHQGARQVGPVVLSRKPHDILDGRPGIVEVSAFGRDDGRPGIVEVSAFGREDAVGHHHVKGDVGIVDLG